MCEYEDVCVEVMLLSSPCFLPVSGRVFLQFWRFSPALLFLLVFSLCLFQKLIWLCTLRKQPGSNGSPCAVPWLCICMQPASICCLTKPNLPARQFCFPPGIILPPHWVYSQEVPFSRAKGMNALDIFWFTYHLQSLYEIQVDEGRWQEVNSSLCRL